MLSSVDRTYDILYMSERQVSTFMLGTIVCGHNIDDNCFHQQVISDAADNWKLLRQLLGEETIWMDGFDQKLNNPPASLDAEEISEEIDVSKNINKRLFCI